ncbi:MAG: BON domain-containing protein [Fimbriiglobus sp.]
MFRLGLAMMVVMGSVAVAQEPLTWPLRNQNSDRMLALKVTGAIQKLPEFREMPMVVDVQRAVAIVSGEVPSLTLLPKLREAIAGVPGVRDVSLRCWDPSAAERFTARAQQIQPVPLLVIEPPSVLPRVDRRVASETVTMKPGLVPEQAVEAIRRSELRFAKLDLAWEGRMLVITGKAPTHEDVSDFIQRVRKLPGIERVRRGSISAE